MPALQIPDFLEKSGISASRLGLLYPQGVLSLIYSPCAIAIADRMAIHTVTD
ncbi:hypothetical protein H6F61_28790 [Cyanobacteria bacterium FACHB-472]|nr:hypothetical protein [Cyanobacteria bacterium FACHB-472]